MIYPWCVAQDWCNPVQRQPSPLEHLRAGIRFTGLVALSPGFPAVDRVAKWAVLA
jgi:hypothetical protein